MRIYEAIQKTVAIYPGRFHPFHKGHASVYAFLKSKFDTVFIATSNKIDPPKSPFSFEEKRAMMIHAGLPASAIVQTKNPYQAQEILANFNPETTAVVFAVSQKDMDEDPRFAFKPKKDGSPGYFQPAADANMVGYGQHGYIMVAPTLDFKVLGKPMRSASEFRKDFASADDETQKNMISDLYGSYDQEIHNIMRNKIKEHNDQYAHYIEAAESVIHDLTVLYEHKQYDTTGIVENVNKIVDKISSIPVVETLDYLDPNDIMDSVVIVPGVGTMSIKGLMANLREKFADLADAAGRETPDTFRNIQRKMNSNIIGIMLDSLVNAFDDIEKIRRKGGKNSRGIPKNVFDSVMHMHEAWSAKYKRSIDCSNPKGFSQKAHCAGRKKTTEDIITEYVFQSIPLRVLDNLSSRKDNKPFPIKTGPDSTFDVTPAIARKFMTVYYQKDAAVQKAIDKTLNDPRKFIDLFTDIMSGKRASGAKVSDIAPDKEFKESAGVGIIDKQNTTPDVKPGETERQSKKLGLGGKPKPLHKSAAKNSNPNKLMNLGITEGYKLQLERDTDMMVLNITDTKTGKRTEVRGKTGYESGGYDPKDSLHILLDKVGKSVDISQLMNGEPVGINPNHPDGAKAKQDTTKAFNEIQSMTGFPKGKVRYWNHNDELLKKVGKLGDYNIHKSIESEADGGDHVFVIKKDEAPLGELILTQRDSPFAQAKNQGFWTSSVQFDPEIQGKGLAVPLYAYAVKKGYDIVSDDNQSKGSQILWQKLSKQSGINVYAWDRENNKFFAWDPEEDPRGQVYSDDALKQELIDEYRKLMQKAESEKEREELQKELTKELDDITPDGYDTRLVAVASKLPVTEAVSQVDIDQLERFADKMFAKVGIDVEFGRHFMDRVNDERNGKPITPSELTRLFKQEYKRYGKPIAQMGPEQQAVMKDLQTDINIPFMLQWDADNNELDLIAKTVMRKKDFKTSNREFAVERGGISVPFASGMIAQIVPHRALKVKKSTPGRLSYDQPETKRKRNK